MGWVNVLVFFKAVGREGFFDSLIVCAGGGGYGYTMKLCTMGFMCYLFIMTGSEREKVGNAEIQIK